MKKTVIGILAHVDAGKTTLSECMLYLSGSIRKLGRVDHGDAFLDYNEQEKQRGITIFSKQAIFSWNDVEITLIDTPGHVDFSAEMERTLQILDYAIVVVNGLDGVQNHTKTIWELLKYYQVPTFIFMNKMDMPQANKEYLMNDLISHLDSQCINFTDMSAHDLETIALSDENILNYYLENGTIERSQLQKLIKERKIFPCYFGSALKNQAVKEFLDSMTNYIEEKQYGQEFGAKVYKITREDGNRIIHMKITGGELKVKQQISEDEKVDRIMQYRGNKYELLQSVSAGSVCCVKGLKNVYAGDVLGIEKKKYQPILSSYMNYRLVLPKNCDHHAMVKNLQQLAEEDPILHLQVSPQTQDIMIQLMGEIQIEVLKKMIKDRFLVDVEFDQGQIIYKETIRHTVEGVGHYEPLRHYAEVHVLLEPMPRGSGLEFVCDCIEELPKNFQRLVMTHLQEKEHRGVLTGSAITDMKITLVSGKAHIKHTEGGDFRQATYRAIRQGLKMTESVLLEPYYQFELEITNEYVSKAIFDLENMNAQFSIENKDNENIVINGIAPIRKMQNYQNEVLSYTKGKGRLYCSLSGYKECDDQEEVIQQINYDSEKDLDNPTGSIFCSHGAGFYVPWHEVYQHMHIALRQNQRENKNIVHHSSTSISDDELKEIFERTYGTIQNKTKNYEKSLKKEVSVQMKERKPQCLLVDGYNVIFAWNELNQLAKENLDVARERLIDIMSNYQGYKKCIVIIVFDAYKVKGNIGSKEKVHNIYVVYTKEAQTADMYIERTTHEMADHYDITVATSDALEQLIVIGQGANRISSRQLLLEVQSVLKNRFEEFQSQQEVSRNYLLEDIQEYKSKKR